MSISYKVRQQRLTTPKGKQTLFIAQVVSNGETTIDHLQKLISKISAVSEGDVRSVLLTLTQLVASELAAGRRVSLGDLGRLRIGISSRAVARGEDFTVQDIRRAKVNFHPGSLIRSELRSLSYQRHGDAPKGELRGSGGSPSTPGASGKDNEAAHAGI
ncbi:MAG: histidinol phosphate phosphatase [Porphyromonadaceae bacterium]|nr:histidinol phosphate phosphatase [Porphyromonadaceae bacterium]